MRIEAKNYTIEILDNNLKLIQCKFCNHVSYNPNDVENKFCGFCNKFLEEYVADV